ncbi:telomere binding protein [Coemansia sp. RSA 1933]|nr:telomere binding protein [Coemansia sp. RSA 1933]
MDSSREEIKHRFRDLTQYIGDILQDHHLKATDNVSDNNDQCLEPEDNVVEIMFPGAHARPLITPILEDIATTANEENRHVDGGRLLHMALQLPLVALGSISLDSSSKEDISDISSWWIDKAQAPGNGRTVALIESRYIGPWFGAVVLGTAAGHILSDPTLLDIAYQYLADKKAGKSAMFAVVAMFGSKPNRTNSNNQSVESLTLATKLLAYAVTTGLLSPQTAINRTNSKVSSPHSSSEWTSFVQIVCTLPDRVANRVDPQSVPSLLLPRQYFSQLARNAVALVHGTSYRSSAFVVDLWTKLCRVGQSDYLCTELAAAALGIAGDSDQLMGLGRILCSVPVPFRETLVYGTVRQMDRIARDASGTEIHAKFPAVLGALLYCQIDPSGLSLPVEQAVSSMLVCGNQTVVTESVSPVVLQSLVLVLQLLSGKPADASFTDLPKYDRVIPDIMYTAVHRTIIPLWSSLSFEIKPTTVLVLMCVGALAQEERERLAMTSEFAEAIPRFLDAPTPRVRLSGIVVADCVISADDVDFGLDDILRDAQRPEAPDTVVASAKYIQELRTHMQPVSANWNADPQQTLKPLEEAIPDARAYVGEEDGRPDSVVLAPRQSSLHSGSDVLQSGFVKPRTPVFLHDCLAYLKPAAASSSEDSGGNNAEKIRIGLFAIANCIENANAKTVEELWLQTANRILFTYNKGPDHLDAKWDAERRNSLVALAVRLPRLVGPFLADRSCDRNMTIRDRELVLSAIASACIQMTDIKDIESVAKQLEQTRIGGSTLGTVVRRSRRLDIGPKKTTRQAVDIVPAFFFPLVGQFGRSDMSSAASDIRRNAALLERYLSTLGVILYTCGSSTHQIAMAREFWTLCRLVRALKDKSVSESPPVLEALLFGVDVILSPERSLSIPTLAREFRVDIADTLQWISGLLSERESLLLPSAVAHASRILTRLREIQEKAYADYMNII